MIEKIDREAVLSWFTGKAQVRAAEALDAVERSLAQGFWEKKASRLVRAALSKQAVAMKFAREQEEPDRNAHRTGEEHGILAYVSDNRKAWYKTELNGYHLVSDMRYGSFTRAPYTLELANKLATNCVDDAERAALARARSWAQAFAPVARAVVLLDSRRPPIRIAFGKTISPTVAKTLVGDRLKLRLETARFPEQKLEWKKRVVKGVEREVPVITIVWPKGTVHNQSRFLDRAKTHARHDQCHACGHAIKNAFNWVPVAIDSTEGVPHAFWIGRDCAKNVFGADVEGDAEYANRLEGR